MKIAIDNTPREAFGLVSDFQNLENSFLSIKRKVLGNKSKMEIGEKNPPSLYNRIRVASQGLSSSYGPTKLHLENLDMARQMNEEIKSLFDNTVNKELTSLKNKIKTNGGPIIIED